MRGPKHAASSRLQAYNELSEDEVETILHKLPRFTAIDDDELEYEADEGASQAYATPESSPEPEVSQDDSKIQQDEAADPECASQETVVDPVDPATMLASVHSASPEDLFPVIKLTREQRDHMQLHDRAKAVQRNKLFNTGNRRYWIGVVNPDTKTSSIRAEDDLIWMKGYYGTTFRTVREFYKMQAVKDFRLTIYGKTPKDADILEELDYFNDQFVIFRPVELIGLD